MLGAMTPAGVRRAARTGLGWITDPRATLDELTALKRIYRDEGGPGPVVAMRDGYIGKDYSEWLDRALSDHRRFWATPRRGLHGRASPDPHAIEQDVLIHGDASEVAGKLLSLQKALAPEVLCLRIELPNWQDEDQTQIQLDRWRLLLGSEHVEREEA
jgi:alkanesulfonate monooxygenase SsuD/methylene tetrahydromethanopterin reductase-like flavin-dependent oxidoreductase (luciferase family)